MDKLPYLEDAETAGQQLFLAALARAEELNLEEEGQALLDEYAADPPGPMPPELEQRIHELFRAHRKQVRKQASKARWRRRGKKTVFLVAALIMLHSALYIAVQGYRVEANNVAESIQDGISGFMFKRGAGGRLEVLAYNGFVPEGFVNTENKPGFELSTARYKKDNLWFHFEETNLMAEIGVHIPEGENNTEINGLPGRVTQNRYGAIFITWYSETTLYQLSGNLGETELKMMAESVPVL